MSDVFIPLVQLSLAGTGQFKSKELLGFNNSLDFDLTGGTRSLLREST